MWWYYIENLICLSLSIFLYFIDYLDFYICDWSVKFLPIFKNWIIFILIFKIPLYIMDMRFLSDILNFNFHALIGSSNDRNSSVVVNVFYVLLKN